MVNFRVALALFFYFSGCLKFFMIVNDDADDAVTSGREVLWDTVGLLESALWLGKSPRGGGVKPTVKCAHLPGHVEAFSQAPCEWSPYSHGTGLSTIPQPPGQPWGGSGLLGHKSPGKQVKLDSFTAKLACWTFSLSVLGL